MTAEQWLLLTDYASKYRVSVSTLRRRIKAQQIPFRFDGGKYYIFDAAPSHPEMAAFTRETPMFPSLKTFAVEQAPLKQDAQAMPHGEEFHAPQAQPQMPDFWQETLREQTIASYYAPQPNSYEPQPVQAQEQQPPVQQQQAPAPAFDSAASASVSDEPLISSATKLLNELKRAYMNILHEKEEQIIHLKEEVSDLKTLVRVLEEDNDRLRRMLNMASAHR